MPLTWKPHNAFVQANLVAGYRYLDLSGVVLNRIADQFGDVAVDPSGAYLHSRLDEGPPFALRFSSERIWLQLAGVDSLSAVVNTAPEWIRGISRDIDVNYYSRLGFRVVHFIPFEDGIKQAADSLARFVTSEDLTEYAGRDVSENETGFTHTFRMGIRRMTAQVTLNTIIITRPPRTPAEYPSNGVFLDIDVWERPATRKRLGRGSVSAFLRDGRTNIEELVRVIGDPVIGALNA